MKATTATTTTAGTNQAETVSASRWIGARLRCASATICAICDSSVSAPTFSASHDEAAAAVQRAADHLVAGILFDRQGFAGHHRLVDGAAALQHDPVDRQLFAGTHAQAVADLDLLDGNLLVIAAGDQPARRLRAPA